VITIEIKRAGMEMNPCCTTSQPRFLNRDCAGRNHVTVQDTGIHGRATQTLKYICFDLSYACMQLQDISHLWMHLLSMFFMIVILQSSISCRAHCIHRYSFINESDAYQLSASKVLLQASTVTSVCLPAKNSFRRHAMP
jgi:hypothetical protein